MKKITFFLFQKNQGHVIIKSVSESLEYIYSKNWNYWKRGTLKVFSQEVSGKSYTAYPLAL